MPNETPAFKAGYRFANATGANRVRALLDKLIEPKSPLAERASDFAINVVADELEDQADDLIRGIIAGHEARS